MPFLDRTTYRDPRATNQPSRPPTPKATLPAGSVCVSTDAATGKAGTKKCALYGHKDELKACPTVADATKFDPKTKESCTLVLDVRSKAEWDEGHVSCAHRVPVEDDARLVSRVLELTGRSFTKAIVVYADPEDDAGGPRACESVDPASNVHWR